MHPAQAFDATAAQSTADELAARAREHKRAASYHRRRAREAMQDLDRLRADCTRLGIRLVIRSQPAGGPEHVNPDP